MQATRHIERGNDRAEIELMRPHHQRESRGRRFNRIITAVTNEATADKGNLRNAVKIMAPIATTINR